MSQPPHDHLAATVSGILEYAGSYLTSEQHTALCMDVALLSLRRLPVEAMEQLAALAAQFANPIPHPHQP